MPVFAANCDSDQMILTHNTCLLASLIPQARGSERQIPHGLFRDPAAP